MIEVFEAGLAQDGSLIKGKLVVTAREKRDAINYCRRSSKKYFILIGPRRGRLNYIKRGLNAHGIPEAAAQGLPPTT